MRGTEHQINKFTLTKTCEIGLHNNVVFSSVQISQERMESLTHLVNLWFCNLDEWNMRRVIVIVQIHSRKKHLKGLK
jgi:hypothetical protein